MYHYPIHLLCTIFVERIVLKANNLSENFQSQTSNTAANCKLCTRGLAQLGVFMEQCDIISRLTGAVGWSVIVAFPGHMLLLLSRLKGSEKRCTIQKGKMHFDMCRLR